MGKGTPILLRSWYPLLAILILYSALSLYQINLPGLHYDEAFEAVPALQLLQGQPVTAFRNSTITLGPYALPLMTQDYIGALNTYLALPFMALLGSTVAALRVMSVTVGGVTLILTFLLAQKLTGQNWVGLLAALLLSVDPTFIFWNRQGIFVTAIIATIGLAATYCWLRRIERGSMGWSIAASFLLGLGLYAKVLFVWLIFGLVGAAVLLHARRLIRQRHRWRELITNHLSPAEGLVAGLAFLLGCAPLLAYNWQTGGTWQNITQNASTSYYGVNNLAVGANLGARLSQFATFLMDAHLWYLGVVRHNFWSLFVFVGLVGGVVILSTRNQKDVNSTYKIALFPPLVIGLVILASIGTVSALWVTHFALLMPWPALTIAVGVWFMWRQLSDTVVKTLVVAALGVLLASNTITSLRYHQALTHSGGLSSHSDAIYDLSQWLAQHASGPVIAMDWGLAAPVTYLTHGQVNAIEIFGYQWQSDVKLSGRLQQAIERPNALYLWRAPNEIIFDRSGQFKALYRPKNLQENIEEAFYEKSGRPLLGVTRLVEKGTATNPPQ